MGFLIAIIILLLIFAKNPLDRRRSDLGKWLLIGAVALALIPGLGQLLLLLLAFGALGFWIYYQKRKDDKSRGRAEKNGWDAEKWDAAHQNARAYEKYREYKERQKSPQKEQKTSQKEQETSRKKQETTKKEQAAPKSGERANVYYKAGSLSESVKKRRRIVENFNKKYGLYLTEEQITSIVNSSYMSEIWKQEIIDMNKKYNVVQEWFSGPTAWLRVYMHAFHIQDITSDIQQQEDIAMYAFEAIFKYVDQLGAMSQAARIKAVNDRFLTDFEDVGFMTAYQFLKDKGFEHKLERETVTAFASSPTVDDLLKKYETSAKEVQEG